MSISRTLPMIVAIVVMATPFAAAQTPGAALTEAIAQDLFGDKDKNLEWSREIGSGNTGLKLRLYADVTGKAGTEELSVGIKGGFAVDARILDREFEALAIELKAEKKGEEKKEEEETTTSTTEPEKKKFSLSDHLEVRVAGFTIEYQKSETNEKPKPEETPKEYKKNPGNALKNGISAQFWLGPVPILVRANATLGVEMNFQLTFTGGSLGYEIKPKAFLHGWASAGVGFGIGPVSASAGVRADLKLLETEFTIQPRSGTDVGKLVAALAKTYTTEEIAKIFDREMNPANPPLNVFVPVQVPGGPCTDPDAIIAAWETYLVKGEASEALGKVVQEGVWHCELVQQYLGLGLTITGEMQAVSAKISLYAALQIGWISKSWSLTLFQWAAGKVEFDILR